VGTRDAGAAYEFMQDVASRLRMYYNFGRVHQTLRVTPAMEASISDHVWSIEEIVALLSGQ
jgi:hypothetical protein